MINTPELDKIIEICEKSNYLSNGCIEPIIYKGVYRDNNNYPLITFKGRSWRLHRFFASQHFEEFDDNDPNQIVMHLCDNPACINVEHLKLGTQLENIQDRDNKGRHPNSLKTHCIRGHILSGTNLIINNGNRNCKICKYASAKRRYSTAKRRRYYERYPRW